MKIRREQNESSQQQQAQLQLLQTNGTNITALVNLQPGATATAQAAALAANNAEQSSLDPIEMLITMNTNNSLDEYYPALAIHLMMKTIKNSVGVGMRKDAISALVYAMRSLDSRCVNYVELVIPPFINLIKTKNDHLVIDLIIQLAQLISFIKKHIEPYLNSIFEFIELYWTSNENKRMILALIDLVQCIANQMDIEFKKYLPKILPLILKQLKSEIAEGSVSTKRDAEEKIFNLLRYAKGYLINLI